jgi:hypothetical protein
MNPHQCFAEQLVKQLASLFRDEAGAIVTLNAWADWQHESDPHLQDTGLRCVVRVITHMKYDFWYTRADSGGYQAAYFNKAPVLAIRIRLTNSRLNHFLEIETTGPQAGRLVRKPKYSSDRLFEDLFYSRYQPPVAS